MCTCLPQHDSITMDMNNLRQPSVSLKIVEIVLLVIAISTFFSCFYGWAFFASSVMLACFINAFAFLGIYLMGYTQVMQTPLESVLYVYYCIGLLVSSILLMATHISLLVASGVFCLFLTFVYCLDLYFSTIGMIRRPESFPPNAQPPREEIGVSPSTISTIPVILNPASFPPTYPETTSTHVLPSYQDALGRDTVDMNQSAFASSIYSTNPTIQVTSNSPFTITRENTTGHPIDGFNGPRP